MNTTGNSRPFALWTVSTATASAPGSSSALGGSSPASISVWRWRATKTAAVVGQQRRLGADDLEQPGDVLERLLRPAASATASRASQPGVPEERGTGPRPPAARGRASRARAGPRRAGRLRSGSPARGAGGRAGDRAPRATSQRVRLRRRADVDDRRSGPRRRGRTPRTRRERTRRRSSRGPRRPAGTPAAAGPPGRAYRPGRTRRTATGSQRG